MGFRADFRFYGQDPFVPSLTLKPSTDDSCSEIARESGKAERLVQYLPAEVINLRQASDILKWKVVPVKEVGRLM